MKKFITKHLSESQIEVLTSVLILAVVGTTGYFLYSLSKNVNELKSDVASSTFNLNQKVTNLENGLIEASKSNSGLAQLLAEQQNQSNSVAQTLGGIASTVNTLEKLSKTDQELLQKYSKVYFLSENYIPVSLTSIDQKYLQDKNKFLQFHTFALPFLTRMLDDANNSGVLIPIVSAYRSFGTQSSLKASYTVSYGSGANKFSADQGYSEHQLGTAVDVGSPELVPSSSLEIKFDTTQAYKWLVNNAYRYGFILSYPEKNTYYQYEPWHWRFVGVHLATYMHDQNKHFYDLDQRQIDTYLANIFD